jgi:hypothetical protein
VTASEQIKSGIPPAEVGTAAVTLRHVIGKLGPDVLQVVVAPRGFDVKVGETTIDDPFDTAPFNRHAIVLAIGTRPDSHEAKSLISRAAEAEAAAVVFKLHGRECDCVGHAQAVGLALLALSDEMSWDQCGALLSLALPSIEVASSIPDIGSVPLGDLFALANAIAGVVGGAVTIEDAGTRVLAYSALPGQVIDEPRRQTILGRQVPNIPVFRAPYRDLREKPDVVVRVKGYEGIPESMPRLAVAIRAGAQMLGSIWVIEGNTRLGVEAEQSLLEAGRIAALHLLHARVSRDINRRTKGDLFKSFLDGRGDIESIAVRLGIDQHRAFVVLAFELIAADTGEEELQRERLVDLVATYSDAYRLQAACAAVGRTVYELLPLQDGMKRKRVIKIARDIHDHARSELCLPVRASVSAIVGDLKSVPVACREAERILRVLEKDNKEYVAPIEDVRSRVTLLLLSELANKHPDLTRGPVRDIIEHDARKGTCYLQTIRAYLEAFGNSPAAAASIGVHPNTFRYRLRRAHEELNIDLTDPHERLVIELQLQLLDEARLMNRTVKP